MARSTHKHHSSSTTKLVFLISCAGLLGAALIVDFLWASSSYSTAAAPNLSAASKGALQKSGIEVVPNVSFADITDKRKDVKDRAERTRERYVPATYAGLSAPELPWEEMPPAPVPRLDGAAIQIKNLLYVFAGYGTLDYVHSHVGVYNFSTNTWGERFDIPKGMGHSHSGVATDGRYIYVVSGQYGPQCRGPTALTFVLDTETKKWRSMPPLPAPRYAPATQLWRGRLHVMGGSKENRHTPGLEHWSIAVKDGKALEQQWKTEIPIPRGGPHRACVVVNDRLFVIGGQEGDCMAKPGSPIFKCSRRLEVGYADVYMLDDKMNWKSVATNAKTQLPHRMFLCDRQQFNYHRRRYNREASGEQKDDPGRRGVPISSRLTDLVSDWKASFPCENHISWFLGGMVVFYIWTAGQRTGQSTTEEGYWRYVEN